MISTANYVHAKLSTMSSATESAGTIGESELKELVTNQVRERKTIEYKLALPGGKDGDHKEFLADVSSFANAAGGNLYFGIEEDEGRPVAIPGLADPNPDAQLQRLESMIRDGISPRMRIEAQVVPLSSGTYVIVLRIPRSWAAPHMVTAKGSSRFYSRNSSGKYPLDVGELRAAFLLWEAASTRMQSFRVERVAQIVAGEAPVALGEGPKVCIHLIPFSSLDPGYRMPFPLARDVRERLCPPVASGYNPRYNFDGFLAAGTSSYVQLFRSGTIEAATDRLVNRDLETIPGIAVETKIVEAVEDYRHALKLLGILPPIAVAVALTNVKGYRLHLEFPTDEAIDRDTLLLPEVVVDDEAVPTPTVLRPAFDALWSACGIPISPHFDQQGEWRPNRGR